MLLLLLQLPCDVGLWCCCCSVAAKARKIAGHATLQLAGWLVGTCSSMALAMARVHLWDATCTRKLPGDPAGCCISSCNSRTCSSYSLLAEGPVLLCRRRRCPMCPMLLQP